MSYLQVVGRVQFPAPKDIVINMLPFVMGHLETVPMQYRGYVPLIAACQLEPKQMGKVGYLSIHESRATQFGTQKRPGIHTDKHPSSDWGGGGWGGGKDASGREDGIYMASTVAGSCRAWDTHIKTPGPLGNCEHLRKQLELTTPHILQRDMLYWMTDSTPHESLPMRPGTYRQWFRLVTHKVDLWYAQHSTENRLVVPPCKIVYESKFDKASLGC